MTSELISSVAMPASSKSLLSGPSKAKCGDEGSLALTWGLQMVLVYPGASSVARSLEISLKRISLKMKTPYTPSWNTFSILPISSMDLAVSIPSLFVDSNTKRRETRIPISACPAPSSPPYFTPSLSFCQDLSVSLFRFSMSFLSVFFSLTISFCLSVSVSLLHAHNYILGRNPLPLSQ